MKNIFVTLILLAAVTVRAQTNSVKGSAEPSASALTGAESVLVIQGGATKLSNVAAIQSAPLAAINATNTALLAIINLNSNATVTASNTLATAIVANAAADVTASNALATAAASASAKDTVTSNSIVTALANYYPSNNPSGFQTSAQVTATATGVTAAALAGAVQSNGVASFKAVTSSNVLFSPLDRGSVPTTYFLDLSTASFQQIAFTNTSGGSNLEITNASAGQNVTVALKNSTGSAQTFYLPNYFQTNVFNITANTSTIANVANTRTLIFNFLTFSSGQVFMSYATAY